MKDKTLKYCAKALDIFAHLIPLYFLAMCAISIHANEPALVITSYFSCGFLIACIHWYSQTMKKHRDSFCESMRKIVDDQWELLDLQKSIIDVYKSEVSRLNGTIVRTGFDPISQTPGDLNYRFDPISQERPGGKK